ISAGLFNCAAVSTEHLGPRQPTWPFERLMEMLLLGIGVGFDTRGVDKLQIHAPSDDLTPIHHVVGDSREGWVESWGLQLRSFFLPGRPPVEFDYSGVRPAGALILGFGGTAAGSEPLRRLH